MEYLHDLSIWFGGTISGNLQMNSITVARPLATSCQVGWSKYKKYHRWHPLNWFYGLITEMAPPRIGAGVCTWDDDDDDVWGAGKMPWQEPCKIRALILGDTLRNGIRIVIDSKSTFDMIISCDEPPVPKTWLENPPQLKLGFPHFDYRRVFASTSPFLLFQSLLITRKSSEFPLNHGPQTWGLAWIWGWNQGHALDAWWGPGPRGRWGRQKTLMI